MLEFDINKDDVFIDNSDDKEANYEINPEILEELDNFGKGIMLCKWVTFEYYTDITKYGN